jgi:hypothetical protein
MIIKKFHILLFLLICFACQRKVNREELINYLNDPKNELFIQKSSNGIDISLQYRPSDLLVQQHVNSFPDSLKENKVPELKRKYNDNLYLLLSLSKNNQEIMNYLVNTPLHSQMVNQFSFGMHEKVLLTNNNKDTLLMQNCTYVPTYGIAKKNTLLLSFDKKHLKNSEYIKFKLKEIGFGTGAVSFKMKTRKILAAPILKF